MVQDGPAQLSSINSTHHWAANAGPRILGAHTVWLLRTAGRNALTKDLILDRLVVAIGTATK
jgi:hypothetical protein